MFTDWPLLSLVVWIPIFGGILVLLSGDRGTRDLARRVALDLFDLYLCIESGLYYGFDTSTAHDAVCRGFPVDQSL